MDLIKIYVTNLTSSVITDNDNENCKYNQIDLNFQALFQTKVPSTFKKSFYKYSRIVIFYIT